jgi:hypothetical protein
MLIDPSEIEFKSVKVYPIGINSELSLYIVKLKNGEELTFPSATCWEDIIKSEGGESC